MIISIESYHRKTSNNHNIYLVFLSKKKNKEKPMTIIEVFH